MSTSCNPFVGTSCCRSSCRVLAQILAAVLLDRSCLHIHIDSSVKEISKSVDIWLSYEYMNVRGWNVFFLHYFVLLSLTWVDVLNCFLGTDAVIVVVKTVAFSPLNVSLQDCSKSCERLSAVLVSLQVLPATEVLLTTLEKILFSFEVVELRLVAGCRCWGLQVVLVAEYFHLCIRGFTRSSKLPANEFKMHMLMLDVCWIV